MLKDDTIASHSFSLSTTAWWIFMKLACCEIRHCSFLAVNTAKSTAVAVIQPAQ